MNKCTHDSVQKREDPVIYISYRVDLHEEKYIPMKALSVAYELGLAARILDSVLHQQYHHF